MNADQGYWPEPTEKEIMRVIEVQATGEPQPWTEVPPIVMGFDPGSPEGDMTVEERWYHPAEVGPAVAALRSFVKQWEACGPNSDFGRYFQSTYTQARAALAAVDGVPA